MFIIMKINKTVFQPALMVLLLFTLTSSSIAQSLIASYPFPNNNIFNGFWGITQRNDTFWIGTDYNGTGYPFSKIYKVTKTGIIVDSLATPFTFNHGLEREGSGFWIAEDYRTTGGRI